MSLPGGVALLHPKRLLAYRRKLPLRTISTLFGNFADFSLGETNVSAIQIRFWKTRAPIPKSDPAENRPISTEPAAGPNSNKRRRELADRSFSPQWEYYAEGNLFRK